MWIPLSLIIHCQIYERIRKLPVPNRIPVQSAVEAILRNSIAPESFKPSLFDIKSNVNSDIEKIMEELEYVECESDLLKNCGIWDAAASSRIFSIICSYTCPE